MPAQFYAVLIAFNTMVGVAVFVILRLWFMECYPPEWRRLLWKDRQFRVMNWRPMWEPWFAWRPIRTVSDKVIWFRTVYRSVGNDYVDFDDWRWYHYGDEFDVLRTPE